eukprot:scaffold7249_cov70-Cyclotella_meneghiniana.AAC.9
MVWVSTVAVVQAIHFTPLTSLSSQWSRSPTDPVLLRYLLYQFHRSIIGHDGTKFKDDDQ